MKAVFSTILAILSVFHVAGQTLPQLIDTSEGDVRIVGTVPTLTRASFKDRFVLSTGLTCTFTGEEKQWTIRFSVSSMSPITVNEGAALLVRLTDGSVIELKQSNPRELVEDRVGKIEGTSGYKVIQYTANPAYEVTIQELNRMMVKGIIKIRMELPADVIDWEFNPKKPKVSIALEEAKAAISNYLAEKPTGDIHQGF